MWGDGGARPFQAAQGASERARARLWGRLETKQTHRVGAEGASGVAGATDDRARRASRQGGAQRDRGDPFRATARMGCGASERGSRGVPWHR